MTAKEQGPSSADAAFEQRARELLREGAEHLDANTRARLTRARAAAVERARAARPGSRWLWVPAGSLAAAALAFLAWQANNDQRREPFVAGMETSIDEASRSPLDDLEILVASESFELLEDLDFYGSIDIAGTAEAADSDPADIG